MDPCIVMGVCYKDGCIRNGGGHVYWFVLKKGVVRIHNSSLEWSSHLVCSVHRWYFDLFLQVVNCSTPANYFHVMRRQLQMDFRKPASLECSLFLFYMFQFFTQNHPGDNTALIITSCFSSSFSHRKVCFVYQRPNHPWKTWVKVHVYLQDTKIWDLSLPEPIKEFDVLSDGPSRRRPFASLSFQVLKESISFVCLLATVSSRYYLHGCDFL